MVVSRTMILKLERTKRWELQNPSKRFHIFFTFLPLSLFYFISFIFILVSIQFIKSTFSCLSILTFSDFFVLPDWRLSIVSILLYSILLFSSQLPYPKSQSTFPVFLSFALPLTPHTIYTYIYIYIYIFLLSHSLIHLFPLSISLLYFLTISFPPSLPLSFTISPFLLLQLSICPHPNWLPLSLSFLYLSLPLSLLPANRRSHSDDKELGSFHYNLQRLDDTQALDCQRRWLHFPPTLLFSVFTNVKLYYLLFNFLYYLIYEFSTLTDFSNKFTKSPFLFSILSYL